MKKKSSIFLLMLLHSFSVVQSKNITPMRMDITGKKQESIENAFLFEHEDAHPLDVSRMQQVIENAPDTRLYSVVAQKVFPLLRNATKEVIEKFDRWFPTRNVLLREQQEQSKRNKSTMISSLINAVKKLRGTYEQWFTSRAISPNYQLPQSKKMVLVLYLSRLIIAIPLFSAMIKFMSVLKQKVI